ncbi:MAG: hypothetical protein ACLFPU_07570 [Dehalococcoidia bacterium]
MDELRSQLHLDPATEARVLRELGGYFREKTADLRAEGLSDEEANELAIESCGQPKVLAQQIYEAHSQGSWIDAAMACLPHFIVAGLFMLSLWQNMLVVSIISGLIVCVSLYGWQHGKPGWLYPWAGYSLAFFVVGGYASWPTLKQAGAFLLWERGSLPNIWLLLGICGLFVFSLWLIIRTTIRVVRRDWILASLMLMPLPIIGGWLFGLKEFGTVFDAASMDASHALNMPMSTALVVLGITSTAFIRLRQRKLKVGALAMLGSLAFAVLARHLGSGLSFPALLLTSFLLLTFLLSPALLEAKIGHGEDTERMWSEIGWIRHPSTAQSK